MTGRGSLRYAQGERTIPGVSLLIGAVFFSCSIPAVGQNADSLKHRIDRKLDDCLGTAENQSTYGMIDCIRTASEEWDKELNTEYRKLLALLPTGGKAALKTAQRAWLAWHDTELAFSGAMYYGMDGSMWKIAAATRHCDMIRQRALELASYRSDRETE